MKIVLISEKLGEPDDEGIAAITGKFFSRLKKENETIAIKPVYDCSAARADTSAGIVAAKANRYFFGFDIIRMIRAFSPEMIVYLPWTSATLRSLLRLKAISLLSGGKAETGIMIFQPEEYNFLEKILIRFLKPDYIYSISAKSLELFGKMGIRGELYVPEIDRDRFRRVDRDEALKLFPELAGKKAALHVGHINRFRIDQDLVRRIAEAGFTPVIVGSPSTPQDSGLIEELLYFGAVVYIERIENLAALYSLADFYFFPVTNERSSVAIPLSVLEALACGTRVITTRFGSLPDILKDDPMVTFIDRPEEIPKIIVANLSL
ncbi:MAG: glycosyltransferase [Deltaproteobacteria bacterium]|nr:glycosyltransferase [Deltaproteobacteria bacterium]